MANVLILRNLYSRIIRRALTHNGNILPGGPIAEIASLLDFEDPVGNALREYCDGAIVRYEQECLRFINGELSFIGNPTDIIISEGKLLWLKWRNADGIHHREDGPAGVRIINNRVKSVFWYFMGFMHRANDLPAVYSYGDNGNIILVFWMVEGRNHREGDQPAMISYYSDGSIKEEVYFTRGMIHRGERKPAKIQYTPDGLVYNAEWIIHGIAQSVENFSN
jgi:hypothetical protein